MNKYGIIYHKVNEKTLNSKNFKVCFAKLKAACLTVNINDPTFILNNALIHYYCELNDTINSFGLKLFFFHCIFYF